MGRHSFVSCISVHAMKMIAIFAGGDRKQNRSCRCFGNQTSSAI